jgi:Tfp pilus assembly protein PilF
LSYASQDAGPALRICEALRAVGLEAWFDQSELRGGDAWDQKIRRQIRECAIFMPLISAQTNARAEGYFRLEWKLAVDRSHLMADDEPFLFPVVVDESTEAGSRVPDRFREVQWTRLTKETPEAIASRVARLLAREEKVAARPAPSERARRFPRWIWAVVGIAIFMFFVTQPLWAPKRQVKPAAEAAAPSGEAAQLAKRALDVTRSVNYTRDSLAVAADLARKATELDSTLAAAWGARARVEATYLNRNWDLSEARRRSAQDFAKRALALEPDEVNALWSQGTVLRQQRAWPEAEAMFQRALKVAPNDGPSRRSLSAIYHVQGRVDEAIAILNESLRHDPRDPLTHYDLAMSYANNATLKDNDPKSVDVALAHLDRSLEIQPIGNALLWKATFQAAWKGDFDGAQATLARLAAQSHEAATEDRAIFYRMWIPLLDRKPERALAAAALTTSTYFSDALVAGPVAWMKAFAHRQAGRESAAIEEWRAAEAVLRARLAASPDTLLTHAELATTLAMLGRKAEASKAFARYEAAMRDQGRPGTLPAVRFHAAMGDAKRTADAIREARKPGLFWVSDVVLAHDPWFDRVRDSKELKALAIPR